MSESKITVLKKMFNPDLVQEYCAQEATPCPVFEEGQEFYFKDLEKPAGFCDWAWDDIHKIVLALLANGDFGSWMKDKHSNISCCTDGLRPVVFKIEKLEKRKE
jgi:uncharacterized repeat protein (TIGR04076 family)